MNRAYDYKVYTDVQSVSGAAPNGIAARCDWVIGHRFETWNKVPRTQSWANFSHFPRTIFIQKRRAKYFITEVLPCFPSCVHFNIILGDDDLTFPKQIDKRGKSGKELYGDISPLLASKSIHKIFVEHLDQVHERFIPVPVGLNLKELGDNPDRFIEDTDQGQPDLMSLPLTVFNCDRVRTGIGQWENRRFVSRLCLGPWKAFCAHCGEVRNTTESLERSIPLENLENFTIPQRRFMQLARKNPFLLCVNGGGIDPNPKVFTALFAGVIPIILDYPGASLYIDNDFPVVVISQWNESALTAEKLKFWRDELGPRLMNPQSRAEIRRRLMADYWFDMFSEGV
jgi:hypothetical protein